MVKSKKVVGIDLGTTNSCISVYENGVPVVIANSEGRRTTPSIVGFMDNGERKVGDAAKRQMVTNPNTIYSIKRLMGKKYKDVKNLQLPYKFEEGDNGSVIVKINGKSFTPQEISAIILQKMKKTAEEYLGEEIVDAVITVPAYFGDDERHATKLAGELAGLNVLRIINEPTAAALSYGVDKLQGDKKIAVFDAGGGTFDISILELGDGVFEVKSINGDVFLGGDNFDQEIVNFLADEFMKEYSVDLRKDNITLQRLREAAEKAKIELSTATSTEINLPYITVVDNQPKHLVYNLTRAKFEQITDKIVNRFKEPCLKAIKDSGFNINQIDEILLVGGSSRIPVLQKLVKDIFGKEPSKALNLDESVAVGAAINGAVLRGEVNDILLLDVIAISVGIETMGNVFTKIIEGNTTIPVSKKQTFSTASDNQPSVELHVLQGERPLAKDNKTLGRFHLDGILPAMRGVPQIEVEFNIDANGILSVTAEDKGTNKKQSIRIEGSSNLSDQEVERMRQEAKANEENDKKAKEEIDLLNSADSMIFQTTKQIKDFGDKLQESEKTELETLLKVLEESYKSKIMDKIKTDMEAITKKWNEISARIYANSSSNNNPPPTGSSNDDNVTDAEFEEVK